MTAKPKEYTWQFIIWDEWNFVQFVYWRPADVTNRVKQLLMKPSNRRWRILALAKPCPIFPAEHRDIAITNWNGHVAGAYSREMKRRSRARAEHRREARRIQALQERRLLMKPTDDEIERIPF